MKIAKDKNNKQIAMTDSFDKSEHIDNLFCVGCGGVVIPRLGEVNKWHFAHKTECEYSKRLLKNKNKMSEFHLDCQIAFMKKGADLESKIGQNRADVLFKGNVYEIQHSPINIKKVLQRNENYESITGKKVIWIINGESSVSRNDMDKNNLTVIVYDRYIEYSLKIDVMNLTHVSIYNNNFNTTIQQVVDELTTNVLKTTIDIYNTFLEEQQTYNDREIEDVWNRYQYNLTRAISKRKDLMTTLYEINPVDVKKQAADLFKKEKGRKYFLEKEYNENVEKLREEAERMKNIKQMKQSLADLMNLEKRR